MSNNLVPCKILDRIKTVYSSTLEVINTRPKVYIIDNFLSTSECDHLINISTDFLKSAKTAVNKESVFAHSILLDFSTLFSQLLRNAFTTDTNSTITNPIMMFLFTMIVFFLILYLFFFFPNNSWAIFILNSFEIYSNHFKRRYNSFKYPSEKLTYCR